MKFGHKNKRPKTNGSTRATRVPKPGARGWAVAGGGRAGVVSPAPEWRGTTVQVCGLWPWSVGSGSPMVGVPLGRHLYSGATVCCDPVSWFQRAQLISNPSVFVLGNPGLGKSTVVRRMATGLAGYGVIPLVLGDLKPDYVELIKALGGQVITLGRGRGHLNVLDPGEALAAAERLRSAGHEDKARAVLADAHGRRLTMVSSLISMMRSAPPTDREETIIDRALKWLDANHDGVPVLGDLLRVIQAGPEEVRLVALDRGDDERYKNITENLEATLMGLVGGGRLGEIFAEQTTTPMRRDRPVVYDVSGIDASEEQLRGAVLLACWSNGFGTVNVANALADAGLEPRRPYFVIMDELWMALRAGRGIVDRADALTRLNRTLGVGVAMISHTMSDLQALQSSEDIHKASGFVSRSGMLICGGLDASEMQDDAEISLSHVVHLSSVEKSLLNGWKSPPAWDSMRGVMTDPPGRGKFLIKVGGRPGIPLQVEMTQVERDMGVHDTSTKWHEPVAEPSWAREEVAAHAV